jgi:hypothetical protein
VLPERGYEAKYVIMNLPKLTGPRKKHIHILPKQGDIYLDPENRFLMLCSIFSNKMLTSTKLSRNSDIGRGLAADYLDIYPRSDLLRWALDLQQTREKHDHFGTTPLPFCWMIPAARGRLFHRYWTDPKIRLAMECQFGRAGPDIQVPALIPYYPPFCFHSSAIFPSASVLRHLVSVLRTLATFDRSPALLKNNLKLPLFYFRLKTCSNPEHSVMDSGANCITPCFVIDCH